MSRRGVKVDVECEEAVVGRPLTVTAVARATRAVEIGGVAVGFVGRWQIPPPVSLPVTVGVSGGKVDWGIATLVGEHDPAVLAAGEERRWSASLGPARFPTLTSLGLQSMDYHHVIEAAVATGSPLGPTLARRAVVVRSPRWINADVAGFVVVADERVPLRATVPDALPGGSVSFATVPGARAELVREERRLRFRKPGKPRRKRKTFGRATAGPDGAVSLVVPAGAAPTMRHPEGELRWFARISAAGGVAEVELNIYDAP